MARQYEVTEWEFVSRKGYPDPFNEVELDVVVTDAQGGSWKVPAFWAGGRTWRARFAPPAPGRYRYATVCSDAADGGLHGRTGGLDAKPYEGGNSLLRHGPPRVAADKRRLEHVDGTPFFWLGDTWWMGLTERLRWPRDFRALAADRAGKGFTVIQIVAGLYPDMPWMDERGANEAGFPWDRGFKRINPAYFDKADRRIQHLVNSGLVPCIVGCWGYFLPWMGIEKMKRHWRYLVARYGSCPAVWCLAGEGTMPYYLSPTPEQDAAFQKKGWTEVAHYVRAIDPFHRPITIHPSQSARACVEDPSTLDLDMLQTGHGDRASIPATFALVTQGWRARPRMPVIQGEVCYEGIGEACRDEVQRWMFWLCILSGARGFTYGANGIWQVNTRERPYGPSPHGMSWGNRPWDEAAQLPGSGQLGLAKRLLERFEWWRFEPHPEWVKPGWTDRGAKRPYTAGVHDVPVAGGIPGATRFIYLPLFGNGVGVRNIEARARYRAFLFNPVDGREWDLGRVIPGAGGEWQPPLLVKSGRWARLPLFQDWLLVMHAG